MFKYVFALVALLVATTAFAGGFKSQSFLNTTASSYPLLLTNTGVFTYGSSYDYTNSAGTRVTNSAIFTDCANWPAADGAANANANVTVRLVGTAATLTNSITFVLAKVGDGVNASTIAGDKFTFVVTPNGTTEVVASTNVPAALLTGAGKVRLLSVTSGAANTNCLIKAVSFNGFPP